MIPVLRGEKAGRLTDKSFDECSLVLCRSPNAAIGPNPIEEWPEDLTSRLLVRCYFTLPLDIIPKRISYYGGGADSNGVAFDSG